MRIKNFVVDVRLLLESFANASFSWVNCEANRATHFLARWSMLNFVLGSFNLGNNHAAKCNFRGGVPLSYWHSVAPLLFLL